MRLIDLFPSWMTGGGIFSKMDGVPWDDDSDVSKIALDIEYFGNRSGHREASALLSKMTAPDDFNPLTEVEVQRTISVLKTMFLNEWKRLWDLRQIEYNPLENYNMTEEGSELDDVSDKVTVTGTGRTETNTDITKTLEMEKDSSDVHTTDGDVTESTSVSTGITTEKHENTDIDESVAVETDMTVDTKRKTDVTNVKDTVVFGMGSANGKQSEKVTDHQTGDSNNNNDVTHTTGSAQNNVSRKSTKGLANDNYTSETVTGNANDNKTEKTILDDSTLTIEHKGKDTNTERIKGDALSNYESNTHSSDSDRSILSDKSHDLTRKGNIGVTTSQQMAQQEIELWKWHYFDTVFEDVNRVLTAPYWRL